MPITAAELYVDCRCTLGEGILWDVTRRALLWTDIERSTLWMHSDAGSRTWRLPDRLGSLALCRSGHVLLALANGLFLADIDGAGAELNVEPVAAVDQTVPSMRTNDGRTDRSGNFVFG